LSTIFKFTQELRSFWNVRVEEFCQFINKLESNCVGTIEKATISCTSPGRTFLLAKGSIKIYNNLSKCNVILGSELATYIN